MVAEQRTFDFSGLFDAIGQVGTSAFNFGSAYVGAQAAQSIATTNANAPNAGVQTTQPVLMLSGNNQQGAVRAANDRNTWLIVGVVVVLLAAIVYFFWKGKK